MPQSAAYTKRSETSRNRSNQEGRLAGSQTSHSKILANLSRNFQEFKEDVRQLKESIDKRDDAERENSVNNAHGQYHGGLNNINMANLKLVSTTRSNEREIGGAQG